MSAGNDATGKPSEPEPRTTAGWKEQGSLLLRHYPNYGEYAVHQAAKLKTLKLDGYHVNFKRVLAERLSGIEGVAHGASVLCLGARSGAECEAFMALGCFALGIDLNPGEGNRFVVTGDFHALQFADRSVDVVYSNALDHVYDFDRTVGEVARVLKPAGIFIAEIVRGLADQDGVGPGTYASAWWDSVEAPISRISTQGFKIVRQTRFEFPWQGDTCVFAMTPA